MMRNRPFSLSRVFLVVFFLLLTAGCGTRPRDSGLLVEADSIHLAATDPSNFGRPVRLTGVVTYFDPEWHLLFLQDKTGGFFLTLKDEVPGLVTGRLVEVTGKLAPGNQGIADPHFQLFGTAPMPAPQSLPSGDEPSQMRLSQWVQINGTVRAASIEDGRLTLTIVDGARRTKARILNPKQARPITFVGNEVQVVGVSASAEDENHNPTGIQIFVSTLDQINWEAGSRKLTDPFYSQPSPFSAAFDRGAAGKLVHLAGTVVEQKSPRTLVLDDGKSKLTALLSSSPQLAPGDYVELLGFVSATPANQLEDSIVRLIAPRTPTSTVQTKGALHTIHELKSLSVEAAAQNLAVDVRGTVTYFDLGSSLLFIQDATAGAYVDIHDGSPELKAGDTVRVQGVSGPGDYAPIISHSTITPLGHGSVPKPQTLSLQTLGSGNLDAGWIETVGIVHSVAQLPSQHLFKLVVAGNSYSVQLPHSEDTAALQHELLDAHVRLRGVCGTVFNERRQLVGLKFFVPNSKFIEILEAAPPDSPKNVRPVIALLRFDPSNLSIHRTTVRGVVTLQESEHAFYLQDATAGMYVVTEQKTQVHTGQLVEVSGFAAVGPDGPALEDAAVEIVNESSQVVPVKLTPEDLTSGLYQSKLVTVDGRLLDRVSGPDEDTLILHAGPLVLRGHLQGAKISPGIRRDSLLEITGILQSEGHRNQNSFRIALPSPGNVRVIEAASWWTPENTARALAGVVIIVLVALLWVSYSAYRVRLYQARHDQLTGLPNRRSALEYLERQMARAIRERAPLGVILADVDHFKKVNDTYGHQAGDAVLKRIAEILRVTLRTYDGVGRYGGEEFLIVVPNCDVAMAMEISERIRLRIMEEVFQPTFAGKGFHVTCSFGVAIAIGPPWSVDFTLAAADHALYAAKNSGRNTVSTEELPAEDFVPQPEVMV